MQNNKNVKTCWNVFVFFVILGRITTRRCVVRSCLVLFILALAQGVPHFSLFLNLVGSSTTVMLTFVFPCLFYLKLQNNLPLHVKVLFIEILLLGCIAGIISTYYAIKAIATELGSWRPLNINFLLPVKVYFVQ